MIYRGRTCSRARTQAPGLPATGRREQSAVGLSTQRHVQTRPSDGALLGDRAPRNAWGKQRPASHCGSCHTGAPREGAPPEGAAPPGGAAPPKGTALPEEAAPFRGSSTPRRSSTPRVNCTTRGSSSSRDLRPASGAFRPRYLSGTLPASRFLPHTWALLPTPRSPPKLRTGTLMWPNECEGHSPGGAT